MQAGEHQAGMLGWTGDNGDPDNFLASLLGCESAKSNGSNVAKFCYQP
jgi:dipeptide transport system substrate-binding protein